MYQLRYYRVIKHTFLEQTMQFNLFYYLKKQENIYIIPLKSVFVWVVFFSSDEGLVGGQLRCSNPSSQSAIICR